MRKRKNAFLTFLFSLLPGAAEMYLGFMRNGISLMALFFLSFIFPALLHLSDVLIFICVLIWFYSFFHARHLAGADDAWLSRREDLFIWDEFFDGTTRFTGHRRDPEKSRRIAAILLILLGGLMLWDRLISLITIFLPSFYADLLWNCLNAAPGFVISILIILLGISLISGRKKQLEDDADPDPRSFGPGPMNAGPQPASAGPEPMSAAAEPASAGPEPVKAAPSPLHADHDKEVL